MARKFPVIHAELLEIFARLEQHYRDMCDTEFTIEQGKLWMLQTRVGKRTGAAALRMAVDMTKGTGRGKDRWKISRREAIMRVTADHLDQVLHPHFAGKTAAIAKGLGASPGAAVGKVYFTADDAADAADRGEQVILVRSETSPEDVHGMMVSEGILTARGGLVSHAAVVARGWGTPAVVGAEAIQIEGKQFRVGRRRRQGGRRHLARRHDTGEIILGELRLAAAEPPPEFQTILSWADDRPPGQAQGPGQRRQRPRREQRARLRRRGHRAVPDRAHVPRRGPAAGRAPHDPGPGRRRGGARRSRSCARSRRPTSWRSWRPWTGCPSPSACSTRRLHEFLPRLDELEVKAGHDRPATPRRTRSSRRPRAGTSSTPCSGTRGVRLGVVKPGLYAMQVRALMEAAAELRADGKNPIVEVMIPLTVTREEMHEARGWVEEAIAEATTGLSKKPEVTIGTMIETPRAALRADEIAEESDFFSFGTNDLTQMTFGFSRDDVESRMMPAYLELGLLKRNPFETIDADRRGRAGQDRRRARSFHPQGSQARGLRRARRRPGVDRPLLRGRAGLRELLALPCAHRPAGGGAGRDRRRARPDPR